LLVPAIFLSALLLGGLWAFTRKQGTEQEQNSTAEAASLIRSMQVKQYRLGPEGLVNVGEVGTSPALPLLDHDAFRVLAEMTEEASCYLIAFAPDGDGVLCFPPDAGRSPKPARSVSYPLEGYCSLPKPGLYAFVLLASRDPLPPYAQWPGRLQPPLAGASAPPGAWLFDGRNIEALRRDAKANGTMAPLFVRELCSSLPPRGPDFSVRVLAFSR
jgi:hypothetical protein